MIIVRRDNDRDLQFEGRKVGEGGCGEDPSTEGDEFGVKVTIYRAAGPGPAGEPRWVVAVHIRSKGLHSFRGHVCVGAKAVLDALIEDGAGRIGSASKRAWDEACQNDDALTPERYEVL
jgi:hypothetical protein